MGLDDIHNVGCKYRSHNRSLRVGHDTYFYNLTGIAKENSNNI
jgi:hypothetical protein